MKKLPPRYTRGRETLAAACGPNAPGQMMERHRFAIRDMGPRFEAARGVRQSVAASSSPGRHSSKGAMPRSSSQAPCGLPKGDSHRMRTMPGYVPARGPRLLRSRLYKMRCPQGDSERQATPTTPTGTLLFGLGPIASQKHTSRTWASWARECQPFERRR